MPDRKEPRRDASARARRAAGDRPRRKPRARRPSPKKDLKRDAVIGEAALEFNARGVSGASLAAIARRVGLTRAALYYYVADREELVFEAYLRACERSAEDLRAARASGACGLDRVLAYVERAVQPERTPAAVLSEIAYLSPERAAEVGDAHGRNVRSLIGFIEAGIRDGSVRRCDAEIAAQALIGMLVWAPLSEHWVSAHEGPVEAYRRRLQTALLDLVADGIAAEPGTRIECPISIEVFATKPQNPFDRREAAQQKIESVLRAACRLFNEKGIDGAMVDEIAAVLGTSKGALYHYFRDKPELVVACYRRSFDLHDRFAEAARATGRSGLERGMIGTHLNAQALASDLSPLMPQVGVNAFAPKLRNEFVSRARRLKREFEAFGREGVADGSCRECDMSVISLIGAGAFGWLPKWVQPGDPRGPVTIADEIVALFVSGLRRRPERSK